MRDPEMIGRIPRSNRGWVVLIMTVFGPLFGAAWFFSGFMIVQAVEEASVEPMLSLVWLPFVVPVGYLAGGPQAFAVGLLLAIGSDQDGRFSYASAFVVSLIVGFIGIPVSAWVLDWGYEFGVVLCVVGVAAALTVRWVFTRRFSPKFQPSSAAF